MDLVAALLRRRYGITFEELSREVPAYAHAPSRATVARMFERDKDELRSLGVPIETVREEEGEPAGYLLRRRDFYLPYVVAVDSRGPLTTERPGYRDLPRVAFDRDALAIIDRAALRVMRLGDPVLAADAASAIGKLAFDLPAGTFARVSPIAQPAGRTSAGPRTFELLDWALRHRKRATFAYRAPDRAQTRREVEPYGLFHRDGRWHLAARDAERAALRDFRLDRMARLRVNDRRAQSPDYDVPAGFDLRAHARQHCPWERGDGDEIEAIVEFRIHDEAAGTAARLGEPVDGDERTRCYRVRHVPTFVRWLLSFGGDAIPIAPVALVSAFRSCVRETLALYESKP